MNFFALEPASRNEKYGALCREVPYFQEMTSGGMFQSSNVITSEKGINRSPDNIRNTRMNNLPRGASFFRDLSYPRQRSGYSKKAEVYVKPLEYPGWENVPSVVSKTSA